MGELKTRDEWAEAAERYLEGTGSATFGGIRYTTTPKERRAVAGELADLICAVEAGVDSKRQVRDESLALRDRLRDCRRIRGEQARVLADIGDMVGSGASRRDLPA